MALITRAQMVAIIDLPTSLNSENKLDKCIQLATDIDLKNFFGCDFYDLFMEEVDVVPAPSSGAMYSLWQQIKTPLSYWTYGRFLTHHPIHITRTGVQKKKNEYSEMASHKDMAREQNRIARINSSYLRGVIKFVLDNSADYPEFNFHNAKHIMGFKLTILSKDGGFK